MRKLYGHSGIKTSQVPLHHRGLYNPCTSFVQEHFCNDPSIFYLNFGSDVHIQGSVYQFSDRSLLFFSLETKTQGKTLAVMHTLSNEAELWLSAWQ